MRRESFEIPIEGDRGYATSRINRAIHQKNAAMETTTMNANAVFLVLKLNAANEPRAKAHRFCESVAQSARTRFAC